MKKLIARFWSKVEKTDGCWNWTASRTRDGYGQFYMDGYHNCAHRVAFQLAGGNLDGGLFVDHICHNRSCVNPDHLRAVTQKQSSENTSLRKDNTSGAQGVSWDSRNGKWRAQIRHHGKRTNLGSFDSLEEAAEVARQKRLELFTHNDLDRTDNR